MQEDPQASGSAARAVTLLVPGDVNLRTGGYGYDREIVAGLRALGWRVDIAALDGSFPYPTAAARAHAVRTLATLPDQALVLADGLAFGVMPEEAMREAQRLRIIALVHHPLADETGLDDATARALEDSERRALACTRGVIVTSAVTGDRVTTFAVPVDRIAVVPPGTTPAPLARGTRGFHDTRAAGRDAHPAALPPVELLCVATLVPRKGHDLLLTGLSRLRHLSWHLTCAGSDLLDPKTAADLRRLLEELRIADRVTLTGALDSEALAQAYDRADLFVLATRYEGYGMAVAEAVARGLPVLSTNAGAIPELVGGDSGVLLPHDQDVGWTYHLGLLLSPDSDLRQRLAAGARRRRGTLPRWSDSAQAMAAALTRYGRNGILQR